MNADAAPAVRGDARLSRNPRVADQVLGGEAVVLDYEGRTIVGLNETGTAVWTRLDGTSSLREIAAGLARESGAPEAEVETDVIAFAGALVERGLAVETSAEDRR